MTEQEFVRLAHTNTYNTTILERLSRLPVKDAWLVSGALFQTVWNSLTGRAANYGIKDYDIFYFDHDVSWEAEDRVIKAASELYCDLPIEIEVRNQARVHLWYEDKFATPYPPLTSSSDGIDRFLTPACMVGLKPSEGGRFELYAPRGLSDIFKLIVRPNMTPNFQWQSFHKKAERWKSIWPEIEIETAAETGRQISQPGG